MMVLLPIDNVALATLVSIQWWTRTRIDFGIIRLTSVLSVGEPKLTRKITAVIGDLKIGYVGYFYCDNLHFCPYCVVVITVICI